MNFLEIEWKNKLQIKKELNKTLKTNLVMPNPVVLEKLEEAVSPKTYQTI